MMMAKILKSVQNLDWDMIGTKALRIAMIFVVAYVVLLLIRFGIRRFELVVQRRLASRQAGTAEASKRTGTLIHLVRQAGVITVSGIALLTILSELGVNMGPILASAGIVGLAIGFGAQNLVRDVISGFFLVLEDQVRVGDSVVVNGTSGLVEEINFRTLVLRDISGIVHVFPNGSVNSLSNMTKGWSAYVFDISVAYDEDLDRVSAVLRQVAQTMRQDPSFGPLIIDDLEIFGLDKFADSAIVLKARFKTLPGRQHEVGRECLRRIKNAFDAAHIEIPFPQRAISLKTPLPHWPETKG